MKHIRVTNKTRITIGPDAEPSNPRTQGECVTGCFRPESPYPWVDGPPTLYDFPVSLQTAHVALYDYRSWLPESNLQRWARVFHGLSVTWEDGFYWFVDRAAWDSLVGMEFTVENQSSVIMRDIEAWRRFGAGRAEVVTLERRATYQRITPSRVNEDGLLHVWEPIESVGDVYIEDWDGSYARLIVDSFGHELTKKEGTVFSAMLDAEAVQNSEKVNG